MKYVAVKHKPEHTKVWWFSVPKELEDRVYVGADALCTTSKGKANGKIVCIMDNVPRAEAEKIIGKYFPLIKPIEGVCVNLPLEDVVIPREFLLSHPSPKKIAKRINELYKTGKFDTDISLTPEGKLLELLDGYTAYLVAKMFNYNTLCGWIMRW